jgi:hypothetical protein
MKKVLLFFIMLFSLALTGCSLDREVNLVRAGSHTFDNGASYIIDSVDELNEYVSNTYNNFDDSVVKYDDAYFESSALVIVEVAKSSGSYKLKMSSVKIDDGRMVVKFKSSCPNTATCDMAYWHIVIECTQEEADSLIAIEIYENGNKVEVK